MEFTVCALRSRYTTLSIGGFVTAATALIATDRNDRLAARDLHPLKI